jgi:hypothetical protein
MGAARLLLEKLLPLSLENLLRMTVYVHFLSDGWMDSKDVWYTDVSYIFNFLRTAETILLNLGRNEVLMIPNKCCCFSKLPS